MTENLAEGQFWLLRDDTQKAHLAGYIATLDLREQPYIAKVVPWTKQRSANQNRLAWKWYGEVAKQGREYTPEQIHQRAKLHFGVPILLEEEPTFQAFWQRVEDRFPTHEDKCDLLMPMTPVTSVMTTKQMARYLTDFDLTMSKRYELTRPGLYGLSGVFL